MTTLNGMAGYRSAYEDYDDDPIDPEELHPQLRKQARKIVHRERRSLLMKWWISVIGAIAVIGCLVGVTLAGIGLVIEAFIFAGFSSLTMIYLISLAHRPAMGR